MKESSMNPTLALEARDVAIHYGGVKAVDGVDLTPVSYTHLTLPTKA